MPEDATPATPETPAAPEAPVYTFPFPIPDELSGATDDVLRDLHSRVREHAQSFSGLAPSEVTDDTITALSACRDLAVSVREHLSTRASNAARLAESFAAIDVDLPDRGEPDPPDDGGGTGDGQPVAVTAADGALANRLGTALLSLIDTNGGTAPGGRPRPPSVRSVAARGSGVPDLPADAQTPRYAALVAAGGASGFTAGQALDSFGQAAELLSRHMDRHPTLTAGRAKGRANDPRRPVTVWGGPGDEGRRFVMTQFNRVPGVEIRRSFPDNLRVTGGEQEGAGYAVAQFAANERRLPGGSLIASAKQAVRNGRALTAAAGWCAASETMYELCELETMDGILDAPEMQTSRGGWNIPVDGGPDFGVIYSTIGSAGDTHLTEAEVIADTAKVCTDIPCPDFEDIRLGVDYVCLTGGLLQRRGYPEVVARWSRGATTALAHKINQGFIADIVTGSTVAGFVPPDVNGDDAASALLSAVHLAVVDAKYRNRMGFNSTLEVVLPWWALVPIRAGLARRAGIAMLSVSDAMILDWFAERGAVPRLVYDWQDALTGLATGPGASAPLLALPSTVQFLIYPAGTWVKAMQDVVSLDTIYDSTRLGTNEYTAIFVEDGWAALQMCPLSRLYTVQVDPSGVTGCCPTLGS